MKTQTLLHIAIDHPAFAGHFPGSPIVPGVVLLDETLHAISTGNSQPGGVRQAWQISSVKFLSPLLPGEPALLQYEMQGKGSIRFDVMSGERHIVTGSLAASTETAAL